MQSALVGKKALDNVDSALASCDPVIKINTLPLPMLETLTTVAKQSFAMRLRNDAHHSYYQNSAEMIKREMDTVHGPTWHVVCGERFATQVTTEAHRLALIHIGQMVSQHSAVCSAALLLCDCAFSTAQRQQFHFQDKQSMMTITARIDDQQLTLCVES